MSAAEEQAQETIEEVKQETEAEVEEGKAAEGEGTKKIIPKKPAKSG